MLEGFIISANNRWARFRNSVSDANEILVLAPHCLQLHGCSADLSDGMSGCKQCGKCRCGDLLEMSKRYGVRTALAGGGTEAIRLAKDESVKAIIAIACDKELKAGIMAVFPKPVLAIENTQPNGPCKNTDVMLSEVEGAVQVLLKGQPSPARDDQDVDMSESVRSSEG